MDIFSFCFQSHLNHLSPPCWCSVLTPTGRFDHVYMPKCTKLSPSDWLIRYLHYGAVEQVVPNKVAGECKRYCTVDLDVKI